MKYWKRSACLLALVALFFIIESPVMYFFSTPDDSGLTILGTLLFFTIQAIYCWVVTYWNVPYNPCLVERLKPIGEKQ
jgi:hypothetical protein